MVFRTTLRLGMTLKGRCGSVLLYMNIYQKMYFYVSSRVMNYVITLSNLVVTLKIQCTYSLQEKRNPKRSFNVTTPLVQGNIGDNWYCEKFCLHLNVTFSKAIQGLTASRKKWAFFLPLMVFTFQSDSIIYRFNSWVIGCISILILYRNLPASFH